MRRLWLGTGLLAGLLALCVAVSIATDRVHAPISDQLDRAAQAALAGDWETGGELARQARAAWESHWSLTACVADHGPMEQIDGLFAQLEVFAVERDGKDFAAACKNLSRLTAAMSDAHRFSWRNLL